MEAAVGRRVLGEVEEASLDEILTSFRASLAAPSTGHAAAQGQASAADRTLKSRGAAWFPVAALNDQVQRHLRATQSPTLSVTGRHLPLVYKIIATLVARPHGQAVVVIDLEHRFDVSRVLQCSPYEEAAVQPAAEGDDDNTSHEKTTGSTATEASGGGTGRANAVQVALADLNHIHVYRPARSPQTRVADLVAAAEHRMLYKEHGSRHREWWGTIVIGRGGGGPAAPGVDVAVEAGWRGWLHVAAQEPTSFGSCLSLEEAVLERGRRQRAASRQHQTTWVASSVWGQFAFTESQPADRAG